MGSVAMLTEGVHLEDNDSVLFLERVLLEELSSASPSIALMSIALGAWGEVTPCQALLLS